MLPTWLNPYQAFPVGKACGMRNTRKEKDLRASAEPFFFTQLFQPVVYVTYFYRRFRLRRNFLEVPVVVSADHCQVCKLRLCGHPLPHATKHVFAPLPDKSVELLFRLGGPYAALLDIKDFFHEAFAVHGHYFY